MELPAAIGEGDVVGETFISIKVWFELLDDHVAFRDCSIELPEVLFSSAIDVFAFVSCVVGKIIMFSKPVDPVEMPAILKVVFAAFEVLVLQFGDLVCTHVFRSDPSSDSPESPVSGADP